MKLLLTVSGFVLFSTFLFAQEEERVIIIDKGERKTKTIQSTQNTSIIKFAPLHMLIGEVTFGYEHKTSQKGSIDCELGATMSNIGIGGLNHYVSMNSNRISGMGFIANFGYRYYPSDEAEALAGFYVSPNIRYKLYTFGERDYSGMIGNENGRNSSFSFLFNFGYQSWLAENFSLEMYAGIGLGYQEVLSHEVVAVYENMDWKYIWVGRLESGARYTANLGIKIGIGYKDY